MDRYDRNERTGTNPVPVGASGSGQAMMEFLGMLLSRERPVVPDAAPVATTTQPMSTPTPSNPEPERPWIIPQPRPPLPGGGMMASLTGLYGGGTTPESDVREFHIGQEQEKKRRDALAELYRIMGITG